MKVVKVSSLGGTEREVVCPRGGFISRRILIESDMMGFTLTHTFVPRGSPQRWHYTRHLEACYCISGHALLVDRIKHTTHQIKAGDVYILNNHDDHTFEALEDTVLICVFNPPLKGYELHNADGSY